MIAARRHHQFPHIVLLHLALVFIVNAAYANFSGPVTDVLDGDTIKVSRNHRNVTIRLNGIDAPEKAQAYSHQAGQFVFLHAFGQTVTVKTFGLDKYGRTIGDVYLPDGTMLNKELVKAGLAWWYCKYSTDQSLAEAELAAREANVGLWQDPKPVPPWVFRKRQRGQSVSRDEMSCFPAAIPPAVADGTSPPTPTEPQARNSARCRQCAQRQVSPLPLLRIQPDQLGESRGFC